MGHIYPNPSPSVRRVLVEIEAKLKTQGMKMSPSVRRVLVEILAVHLLYTEGKVTLREEGVG